MVRNIHISKEAGIYKLTILSMAKHMPNIPISEAAGIVRSPTHGPTKECCHIILYHIGIILKPVPSTQKAQMP